MHFEEEDDDIPLISGTGEAFMDAPGTSAGGSRRDEDIALDLMKFIAMTTGVRQDQFHRGWRWL